MHLVMLDVKSKVMDPAKRVHHPGDKTPADWSGNDKPCPPNMDDQKRGGRAHHRVAIFTYMYQCSNPVCILQMTINFEFLLMNISSSRHSNSNFAHHFVIH